MRDGVMRFDVYLPTLIVGGLLLWSVVRMIGRVLIAQAREKSRREIAAYIAEGSMTAEHGERLMKAGEDPTTIL